MNYPNYASTADIEVINGNIKKLVQNAEEQDTQIKSKEPIINKKTGFNLDKTDLTENDSNKLFSAKGALNLFNTLTTNFNNGINSAKEALRLDIARKEDKFGKNSGFNREKTDLVENDTNKVFSAKGAFDLKTYLITNYTTLMNNIRDTLTNSINTKLPHGGYNQSAQTLKNEIDDRYTKSQTDSRYPRFLGIINTSTNLDTLIQSGYFNGQVTSEMLGGFSIYEWGLFVVEKSEEACVQTYYSHRDGHIIRRVGYGSTTAWNPWYRVYTSLQKPTKEDVGLGLVDNTADVDKNVLTAAKLKTSIKVNETLFDGSKNITTKIWGAVRSFQIGNSKKNIDGSTDISWSLEDMGSPEIKNFMGTGAENVRYKRIGIMKYIGDSQGILNCIVTGGMNFANPVDSIMKLSFSSRGWNGIGEPSSGLVDCISIGYTDGFKFYVKKGEDCLELWVESGLFNYPGRMLILNSHNFIFTLDGDTVVRPPGLVGGIVRKVYHEGNKPTATDVGLGNVSNVAQVTDIRMSGNIRVETWITAIDTYASGRVQTGSWKDSVGPNLDGVYYATLQKQVNGIWYTVATD